MVKNVIVIGGGIAGLAVAAALAQRGVAVTLIEQAERVTEVGAGLQVSPNGLVILNALGLATDLEKTKAVEANAVDLVDYAQGDLVARVDLTRLKTQKYLFLHRADLIQVLLKAAREANVSFELGKRVTHVEVGPVPQVHFEGGGRSRAEFIIAADGLHSVARPVVDGPTKAEFTGQVAWRALIPASKPAHRVTVSMGPGRHIVSYPIRGGSLTNLVAVQERETWAEEGWHHEGDSDALRKAFSDFGGHTGQLLENVDKVGLWGLFRHPVAHTWIKENVALIGDSAHPTLPFLAQGANMALEDAWGLASCLTESGSLADFEVRRRARTARIVTVASGNAWKYHLRPGPLRWAAHQALGLGSRLMPGLLASQFDWIYRHDETAIVP